MHIDPNLSKFPAAPRAGFGLPLAVPGPAGPLPAHKSLRRVLSLLHAVNVQLSLFTFEALPGTMSRQALFSAVESAVDDSGLAFEAEDGRIGALVYGWRPPGANDSWVESRTLARLDWALGVPNASRDFVDCHAIHRPSDEVATDEDATTLLLMADRVDIDAVHRDIQVA